MRFNKLWIVPIVIAIGLAFYVVRSKESASSHTPEPPIVAQVQERPLYPLTHRIGVSIPETANQNLADTLKPLRPSWIRCGVASSEFFALCSEVQANPLVKVSPTLSDDELQALGQLIAQNAEHFSQVLLEMDNEDHFSRIKEAAGSEIALRKINPETAQAEPSQVSELSTSLLKRILHDDWPILISNYEAPTTRHTVELFNDLAGGSLHPIAAPKGKTWAAFRSYDTWSATLVSEETVPIEVVVTFPRDGRELPTHALILTDATLKKLPVTPADQTVTVTLPAHSLVVLTNEAVTPEESASE